LEKKWQRESEDTSVQSYQFEPESHPEKDDGSSIKARTGCFWMVWLKVQWVKTLSIYLLVTEKKCSEESVTGINCIFMYIGLCLFSLIGLGCCGKNKTTKECPAFKKFGNHWSINRNAVWHSFCQWCKICSCI